MTDTPTQSLSFERTTDYPLIRRILTDPAIWPWITDDFSPSPDDFQPVENEAIWYVLAKDGPELLGLWMFVPQNGVCWEVHTCLLPDHGFHRGRRAARAVIEWLWANTPCRRLVTNVPRFNRAAAIFAKAAGMTQYGVNPASYQHHAILHDQILLGISRPESEPSKDTN